MPHNSIICSRHHIRTWLLVCVALIYGTLAAQEPEARFSLSIRNATLEEFARQLESRTGFTFVYGEEVRLQRRITLEVREATIGELLERAFRHEPVAFEVSGKHILLRRQEKEAEETPPKPARRRFTISGYVTDEASAETLIGANILERRRGTGTTTNPYGFYTLTLTEGEAELCFSYLGYETLRSRFRLKRDTVLHVRLRGNNRLEEVVVVSDRREAGIASTAMGAHEVPLTQIRHTPAILGEADLLKTIQLMPGVQAGVEGFAGMHVRGGSPDQNLVMLDGISVYNADHLLGIFSIFTAEAVKGTTLFKSSFPARYGGRLSSVVDVRTNDGDLYRHHGSVSVGGVTDKLHLEGPLWRGRTSFSLSARVTPTIFFKNVYTEEDDYGASKYNFYFYDFNAKVSHRFNDRSRLFLGAYSGNDHFHYDSQEKSYPASQPNPANYSREQDRSRINWGNTIAYLRWNYVFGNRLFANATVSYNNYRMRAVQETDNAYIYQGKLNDRHFYRSGFRSGIRDWSARLDLDYTPAPRHHIKLGTEYMHHLFRPGISTSAIQDVAGGSVTTDTLYRASNNRPLQGQELSLYGEDNLEVNRRLSLNAGVRLSLFHTQGKGYTSAQPRLSARYRLDHGFSAKASYTCMAQYVHLLSATSFAMPTDLWVPITKEIRPMYANQYSLGGYYTGRPGWEFSVEGYYKQMRNILEYQDGVSFFGNSVHWEEKVEMGQGRSYGIEAMVQKTGGKTTGWLAYTLSKTEHRFKEGYINQGRWFPYKYDRRHNLSLCVNHTFSPRIDVAASWIYYTGGCITVPERVTVLLTPEGISAPIGYVSHRNNYRLPASHRLNLGINFNRKIKRGIRTWNISLYNAYNAMNPSIAYCYFRTNSFLLKDDNGNITIQSSSKTSAIVKKTLLPFVPSVSYTYRF